MKNTLSINLLFSALEKLGSTINQGRIEKAEHQSRRLRTKLALKNEYAADKALVKQLKKSIRLKKKVKKKAEDLRVAGVPQDCIDAFLEAAGKLEVKNEQ